MKIFLHSGHGGKDSGACANGLIEKELNLKVTKKLKTLLENQGIEVFVSENDLQDNTETTREVINNCNNFNPAYAIDIHFNAGGGNGFEVFHSIAKNTKGKILATNINNEILASGIKSRGLKTKINASGSDYFYFLREIEAPSIILEGGFLDGKEDCNLLKQESHINKLVNCYFNGILKTLDIKKETFAVEVGTLYKVQVGAFKNRDNAEKLKNELINKGYQAFIVKGEV